jgi:hypothetical protein
MWLCIFIYFVNLMCEEWIVLHHLYCSRGMVDASEFGREQAIEAGRALGRPGCIGKND